MPLPVLGLLGLGGASAGTAGAVVGGLNAALGVAGVGANFLGAQQKYAEDKAYANASSAFANWQAGFNARVNDANNQYKYWQDTVNYNQELAYVHSQRNFETLQAIRQAEVVRDTRAAAGAAYIQDSEAINDQYAEQEMAAAVAQQQYSWRALQARSSVRASGREGNTVDRLVNNFAMQEGSYMALEEVNAGIRGRQLTRAQSAKVAEYLSRWNSQDFYEERTIFDPVMPFPPLPTMITPPPPSRIGSGPSPFAAALEGASALMGGLETGLKTTASLKRLQMPRSRTGSGTAYGSGLDLAGALGW